MLIVDDGELVQGKKEDLEHKSIMIAAMIRLRNYAALVDALPEQSSSHSTHLAVYPVALKSEVVKLTIIMCSEGTNNDDDDCGN